LDKLLKDKVAVAIFKDKKKKHKNMFKSELVSVRDQLEQRFKELDRRVTELMN
jgi:hypothetical protein